MRLVFGLLLALPLLAVPVQASSAESAVGTASAAAPQEAVVAPAQPATAVEPAAVPAPTVPPASAAPAAPVAHPAGAAQAGSNLASGMGGQLVQLMLGLLLVIGLIFVLAWLVRRVQGVSAGSTQVIELLGSRALGPRDRLVLVQVGKEQVLLGVTPGRITPLHVLAEPVQVPVREQATPEFAQRLLEMMGKDKDKK